MAFTALQAQPIMESVHKIDLPLVTKAIAFGLCQRQNTITGEQYVFALSGNQSH